MRGVALVALALLLSGCLAEGDSTTEDPSETPGNDFQPVTHTFEFDTPAGVAIAGDYDPARQSWTFEVAEGASSVFIEGRWRCVSLCPLDVTVEDGVGNVLVEGQTGGWSDSFQAVEGTWTLTIASSENQQTTVGTEGKHTVTVS